jgi:hypothetical protein
MRKRIFALFSAVFFLLSVLITGSVLAKPVPTPIDFDVTGTFNAAPFSGTVTVDTFVEEEGQLAVRGTLVSADQGLFDPLTVTIFASARAFEDTGTGCTVEIDTVAAFIDTGFIIFLNGAVSSLTLSESEDPDAARELCRVVQTATRDPADQGALARALNKVVRNV